MSLLTQSLTDQCTYWAPTTKDEYGVYSFAAPRTVTCRIRKKQKLVRGKDGVERLSTSSVMVEEELDLNGRILMSPGGTDSTLGSELQAIEDLRSFAEPIAWRVFL